MFLRRLSRAQNTRETGGHQKDRRLAMEPHSGAPGLLQVLCMTMKSHQRWTPSVLSHSSRLGSDWPDPRHMPILWLPVGGMKRIDPLGLLQWKTGSVSNHSHTQWRMWTAEKMDFLPRPVHLCLCSLNRRVLDAVVNAALLKLLF